MSDLSRPEGEPTQEPPSLPASHGPHRKLSPEKLPAWIPPLFFLLLALIFLWRSVFAGDVFLPATLLGHVAPWKGTALYTQLPPWNPLRWDGIGQFYPWRKFAAETLRAGYLPLWNPYQFCGTPFVANSQSAVFYPGSLLFVLIPDTAYAFSWSAVLHLTLCGWFCYLLLRRLRCSEVASLLGGVVYAYSAWQAAWLQLPTFLATSCWFPLLLRQIHLSAGCFGVRDKSEPGCSVSRSLLEGIPLLAIMQAAWSTCGIGLVVGLMLLAGHLQIALYGLVTGTCFALGLLAVRRAPLSRLLIWSGGLALGLMLAMPQLLPAIELSRISHRVGKPSMIGFKSYTNYALTAGGLVQLVLPDFFGGDSDPGNPYWGYYRIHPPAGPEIAVYHNPAETAVYVGILPFLLASFACVRGVRRGSFDRRTAFFAALALLALLLALGTPVNAIFYYGIPGFAQSGSPARCLVLWALAVSVLAALGLDRLSSRAATKRELTVVFGAMFAVAVLALKLAAEANRSVPIGLSDMPSLGEVFARIGGDWIRLAVFLLAGIGVFAAASFRKSPEPGRAAYVLQAAIPVALLLVVLDLFWTSIGANPTARREQVYPETKGIAYLREHAGHNRIFPVNQRWSLFATPSNARLPVVLPPNAATVFGLRDVQGYDSLFSGRYKAYANHFARPYKGVLDASPVEVGNIVFFQNANAPGVADTAAVYAIAIPYDARGFSREAVPRSTPLDIGDTGMTTYELPGNGGRARLSPNAPGASLEWQEDLPTRVALTVNTPSDTTLSLLDSAMPGWRLRIDGQPVSIATQRDNPILRSAPIAAGRHTAAFRYEPASFRVGLYAACAALLMASLSGALHLYRSAALRRARASTGR